MWLNLVIVLLLAGFQIATAQFGVVGHAQIEPTTPKQTTPKPTTLKPTTTIPTTTLKPEPPTTKKPVGAGGQGIFGVAGQGFVTEAAKRPVEVTKQSKPSFNNILCKYGIHFKRDCCYGWKRVGGQCYPICEEKCVHGKCVGPNKCECDEGFAGPLCNQDYNECGDMPWRCNQRCMNTLGSYKCYCDHGYILQADQYTCSRDNRCDAYRCVVGCEQYDDGFRCICPDGLRLAPNGLSCIDIDECEEQLDGCASDRVCRNTFGNFYCSCPEGLSFYYDVINGKKELVCRDRNECDGPNDCDANADCINKEPGYSCSCKAGYAGDGSTCTKLDTRGCQDTPCFPGVECVDIPYDPADPFSKLFVCRSCPPGYAGDGIDCLKVEQKIIVVVDDDDQAGVPVEEARVTIYTASDDTFSVTEIFDQKSTSSEGFVELSAPGDETFVVTVTKEGYFDNSKSYTVVPGKNVVKFALDRVGMAVTKDITYSDSQERRVEFDFNPRGDVLGQDGAYSVTLYPGSLSVADGTVLEVSVRGIDIREPESLARAPELIGTRAFSAGDFEMVPLESFGMAEISVVVKSGRGDVNIAEKITLEFPLNAIENSPGIGETVGAYYFDSDKGAWYKDGEGVITTNRYGDKVWMYNATHLSWWNADKEIDNSNCVTVTACYDADCYQPAGNTMITLSGSDFSYTTSQQTDENGQTCFNFKQGGTILLTAPCSGGQEYVAGSGDYSICPSNLGGLGLYSNGIENAQGSACQGVKFILQGISQDCPDPGTIQNGIRLGNDFTYGSNVTFFCDGDYNLGSGSGQRVCHSCGDWSGSQPFCFETDYESSGVSEYSESLPLIP